MKEELSLSDFISMLVKINQTVQDNSVYLSELDSMIGDGDHGTTIARGFRNVIERLGKDVPASIGDLLKTSGMTLISTMGGTAGPIFGTLFTEMAKPVAGKETIGLENLYEMFSLALEKISKLGGAKQGDKTLVDSLYPSVESLKKSIERNLSIKKALEQMSLAAYEGAVATKSMVALKGRAKYLGDRSLGYQDAGATTMYLIIRSMYEAI